MTDANPKPESPSQETAGPATGTILKEKRLAAKIEMQKICSDLRLSPSVIEAIESGNYHLLPGDPYIRALLGSLGRYLNLDTMELIRGYNREMGTVQATAAVAPYKDRAHTYTAAHKQIFVAIFLGLFVILFLIIAKLNKGEHESLPNPTTLNNGATAESLAVAMDTTLESRSLLPDSVQGKLIATAPADSGDSRPKGVGSASIALPAPIQPLTPTPPSPLKTAQSAPSTAATPTLPATPTTASASVSTPTDPSHQNVAIIKPVIDSVGIKVLRAGKEDFTAFLRIGKQMQVSHNDTITVFTSKPKSIEVIMDGKSVIPNRKRFKIIGNTIKTF